VAQPAFQDFFQEVWTDLSGYARSLTGDAGTGDDLAQEAMTRVYARYLVIREPRPYAFRIVTNLVRQQWRTQERERRSWQQLVDVVEQPDRELLDAVRRLRPAHREVLLLHYWGDLRVEDVAAVLRRPTGTVKRRLVDARNALSSALEVPR
jgi:RNA polymerase sigma-70 factor (ECF subfamily)